MEIDPIYKLSCSLEKYKKNKDLLENQVKKLETEIEALTGRIKEKEKLVDDKAAANEEFKAKAKHIDDFIAECEKSVKKIIQTSLALQKSIDKETETF